MSDPTGRKISRKRAAIYTGLALVVGLLVMDVCLVFPYLLSQGFYFESEEVQSLVVDSEQANNLLPNEAYLWDYKPNTAYRHRYTGEGVEVSVQINSIGFRDEEPEQSANADFRFVALGDSFTFGRLVQHQDRWDEVLARRIEQATGRSAGSVNLGRWMFTFDQHALVLEEYMPERCDMVIHLVYPSHVQTINRHEDVIADGKILRVVDPMLHVKDQRMFYGVADDETISKQLYFPFTSCLVNYLSRVRKLHEYLEEHGTPVERIDEKLIYQEKGQEYFEKGWELTELAIRQVAEWTRQRDVPYLVVVIPRSLQLSEAEWGDTPPIQEVLTTDLPQQRLRQICRRTGWARYLDLLPAMRQLDSEKLYWKVDPHWRPAGHEVAAEEILRFLEREGLFTGTPATVPATGPALPD